MAKSKTFRGQKLERDSKGRIVAKGPMYEPGDIVRLFNEYVESSQTKPRNEKVVIPRTGSVLEIPREKPLSWDGFYCWLKEHGHPSLRHYREERVRHNFPELYEDIDYVNSRINDDNFSGGAVGIYNPNLMARVMESRRENSSPTDNTGGHELPIPVFKMVKG